MANLPDWVIAIVGLLVGGLFTILGYLLNGILELRREKFRLTHEDVRFTRESIAKRYIENTIEPIQRDLARNLGVISEMEDNYVELILQNELLYSDSLIRLLDRISAAKLEWDQEAKHLGVVRLDFFGHEFWQVALAGYRAIEMYHTLARFMASDLRNELQADGRLPPESVDKARALTKEGEDHSYCVSTVLEAIRDLDLLGQAIHTLEMESYKDVMLAKGEDIQPLPTLRKIAKAGAEKFERYEKGEEQKRKRAK